MSRILVSAGDASGDLHAAALVTALRRRLPDVRVRALGGVELEKAGAELVVHQREVAVGGLVEALPAARRVFSAWRRLGRVLREDRPDLVVLVDSPDLNLPVARRAKRAGVPVLYFIPPQVWAWRPGRIRKLARRIDRLAVIFPFEPAFYAEAGLPVDFVGHPLVDRLAPLAEREPATLRAELGLPASGPLVLLLPGSRHNELDHGLPLYLEIGRHLAARRPDAHFALALAPTVDEAAVQARVDAAGLPVRLVRGRTHEAVRAADVALAKPGTIAVEITLLGRPMVVAARANALSAAIARRMIDLPWFTMPNLIAGAPVVPEFLQEEARPERVAEALEALLAGPARELQLARLAEVRRALGGGGAAERAAEIAVEMMDGPARA
jgi:lipid-A-disaccharide synthase